MKPLIHYIDGKFLQESEALISPFDLGVLRSYAIFELLRTYRGVPFHLIDHLERLFRSSELVQLEMVWTIDQLVQLTHQLLKYNPPGDYVIRILVSGGTSSNGILPNGAPKLAMILQRLPQLSSDSLRLSTFYHERFLPTCKTTNYLPAILAIKEAKTQGADEALYVDRKGYLLEATRSNFFAFKGNALITPDQGILEGITRKILLQLWDRVEVRPIHLEEIEQFDMAFISSSLKELAPVSHINQILVMKNLAPFEDLKRRFELYVKDFVTLERASFNPIG